MSTESDSSSDSESDEVVSPQNVQQWAVSDFQEEKFEYLWELNRYPEIYDSKKRICSPIFVGGPLSRHAWKLILRPAKRVDGDYYLAVFLKLKEVNESHPRENTNLKVRFQFSVIAEDGTSLVSGESGGCSFSLENRRVWGIQKLCKSDTIFDEEAYLTDDETLRIRLQAWIGRIREKTGPSRCSIPRPFEPEAKRARLERLATDFGNLRLDDSLTDVAISTKNTVFMAHRCVLSGRSQLLRKSLINQALSGKESHLDFTEFDDDIVKMMLEYVYASEFADPGQKAADLLQISIKCGLESLKEECIHSLSKNLNIHNVSGTLVIADQYDALELKQRAIDYMNFHIDEVRKTNTFQQLANSNTALFLELFLSS